MARISSTKRCLGFVAGTVGLIGLIVLTSLGAIAAPAPATAGPVGHKSASATPVTSSGSPFQCKQVTEDVQGHPDCNAVADASGHLSPGHARAIHGAVSITAPRRL